ncbi:flagellar biosynthetic protein FliO [Falsiroseomonas sp. CW058]|uniref:flagellar biosynthetic protein FliO n=1 Tax=Falsiroseomonas sp. CW058 TaxID=3388664 RepID=UPI003D31030F
MPDALSPATLLTAAAALAAVVGALVLLLRGLRAAASRRGAGRCLAVEEAVALDSRRRLVLARCDGRRLLLLTGGAQDVVVGWVDGRGA